jgi:formylglycine-generating enzyme required for sulfatase activity
MKTKLGLLLLMLLPAVIIFSVTANCCSAAPIEVTDVSGNFTSTVEVIGIVGTSVKVRRSNGSTVEMQLATFDKDSLIKILIELGRKDVPKPKTGNTITNTIGMKFNKIPDGTFLMGSLAFGPSGLKDEHLHKVTITKPFYVQTTEVTQGQWKAVMGTEPWKGDTEVKEGANYPATYVNWDNAVAYCKKLSEKEGKTYRLPTEAEWEYACRAGTKTAWSFGDNEKEMGDYAWYPKNTKDIGEDYAHQVRLKKPNAFGLYDMHGNVLEWCSDYYESDYYEQSPEQDPQGPTTGFGRVYRGGAWWFFGPTAAYRNQLLLRVLKLENSSSVGFRLVREVAVDSVAVEKAAAVAAALAKGDWKAVLELEPNNWSGLRLKVAAAVEVALAKDDWKAVLELEPNNWSGLRLKVAAEKAAEKAAILAGDPITNTFHMTFNKIPTGTFMMGSPETEENREDGETQHQVTISKAFYMQTTEVTQAQWKALMGTEPWRGKSYVKEGPNYAAAYVSWDDAVAYCEKLSKQEGKTYRLPTEVEWEYACRAGTKTTWNFGNNENELSSHAWYRENALDIGEEYAHQVGLKKPNAFGLYDMHGNVWEWCHDYFEEDYYKQSPKQDPTGPTRGSFRVLRGGSWYLSTRVTRSAGRNSFGAGYRHYYNGFRVVRELD